MAYWLMKSEPGSYGWDDLVRDGETEWDGVRNAAAAIHLRTMTAGDHALFYHSGDDKAAVGVMEVVRAWQPDGPDGKFASVRVKALQPLPMPVTLKTMKADARLAGLPMIRQSRLSVSPVSDGEWSAIMELAQRE
jgi:predicted RNA-binding protein with PUA-like domain